MTNVDDTLDERGTKYGDYGEQAAIVERLIETIRKSPNWDHMPATHRVALYLIALKIGRVCTGDVNYDDNWRDIAGYATLVEREINGQ
jgi:hypothetical protein